MTNPNINLLDNLKIIRKKDLKIFHQGVRDNADVQVLIDPESELLILDKCLSSTEYYLNNSDYASFSAEMSLSIPTEFSVNDDYRRFLQFKDYFFSKSDLTHLDFGCGKGDLVQMLIEKGCNSVGVELNKANRLELNKMGVKVKQSINAYRDESFDLITLFHVFEHLVDLDLHIESWYKKLKKNGLLIIEVPHALDALIRKFNLSSFKSYTFWSEHLVLWTAPTLISLFSKLGFNHEKTINHQRYPLSNHLHWIFKGKPGGHKLYPELNMLEVNKTYVEFLSQSNETDTIILVFSKK
jgi:2-polyprenyl-3-methyl-5-hydroxy-6-metoxy-1,4-benzoquinol methylase